MRILLLILGLYLSCTFQDQTTEVEEDFDMTKLSGRWYPFLLSSTFRRWENQDFAATTLRGWINQDFGASIYEISVTVDDLIMIFSFRNKQECKKMQMTAYRVKPNRYRLNYPGRHEFHIEDADPDDFLLISTTNEFDIKILGVELYSRRKEGTLNQIAKNKFQQLCQLYVLANGSYIDLTTTDRCFLDEK